MSCPGTRRDEDRNAEVAEGTRGALHLRAEHAGQPHGFFNMDIPDEVFPDAIEDYGLTNENQTITLTTEDYDIEIEVVAT